MNHIIKNSYFNNSIENIFYKNLSLHDIAKIIQKRFKFLFTTDIKVEIKKYKYKKKFKINQNQNFKFNIDYKKIYFEIDTILKYMKKIIRIKI